MSLSLKSSVLLSASKSAINSLNSFQITVAALGFLIPTVSENQSLTARIISSALLLWLLMSMPAKSESAFE